MAKYTYRASNLRGEHIVRTVEAISFEELIRHGFDNGANVVNEMPWSWQYKGHAISHENDECYLIPSKDAKGYTEYQKMTPGCMLVTTTEGFISVVAKEDFMNSYELISETEE